MNAIVTHMDTRPAFTNRLEVIKQYQQGLVSFTELLLAMQMSADELDGVMLMQAAHVELAMNASQLAGVLDDMLDKHNRGLQQMPRLSTSLSTFIDPMQAIIDHAKKMGWKSMPDGCIEHNSMAMGSHKSWVEAIKSMINIASE